MSDIRASSFLKLPLAASLASMTLLFFSGCITPNVFTVALTLEKNGDYHFIYSGTYYDQNTVMALRANRGNAPMADHLHDLHVTRAMETLFASGAVISLEYIGNGLFNACWQIRGNIRDAPMSSAMGMGNALFTLEELPNKKEARFSFTPVMVFANASRSVVEELASEVDGTIEVYTELPVIRCDGDPGAPPGANTAVWRVKGWEKGQKPLTMTISSK